MAVPYTTPIPGAAGQGQAALLAKTAWANALAKLNQQRQSTLRQYGYAGQIDPTTGTITNIAVDAQNPYGRLQQMLRSQALEDQSAVDDAAGRGLHGGLAHRAEGELRYAHGGQSADLGQALTGSLADFQGQQDQATYDRNQALYQAQLEDARNAIQNEAFNPANFDGLNYPAYGEDPLAGQPLSPTPGGVRAKPKPKAQLRSAKAKVIRQVALRRAQPVKARR